MKTLKKALSIILGLALMLSCVAGMQVSVAAEGTLAISVGEATVADGVVTVPVVVDANTGFQSLAVEVDYDDTVLTLVEGVKSETFATAADSAVVGPVENKPFKMMWAYALSEENVTATGTIATLTFNVVEGANVDSTDINIEVTEAWDVNGNEVTATATDGTVEFVKEPVVDSTLKFASVSVGYGTASLQISFRVNNTVLNSYADMELVIIPQKYDLATLNLVENPAEIVINKANLASAGSTRKQYIYTDIYLYELGLDIDYMLRAYDAQGNLVAVSETFTTSAASYLKNIYASSTDAKFRTLVADTLVVGASAVTNTAVSYPNSDLAKATSIIEGFDTSEASQTVGETNTINEFVSNDSAYGTANSSTHQVRTSVQIGKVPFINFRIADSNKVLDFSKLVVTVNYTSKDSAGEHPYEYTFTGSDFSYAGKYINCTFDQVGLHDGDKDILFTVTYDGVEKCTLTYSIETYLGANMSHASIGEIATALVKLGQSFRAYQGL